jgi:type I site-specific restriction-modification system R (restriction) subunit
VRKERLLDLIRNFIIFDAGQKKVPGRTSSSA